MVAACTARTAADHALAATAAAAVTVVTLAARHVSATTRASLAGLRPLSAHHCVSVCRRGRLVLAGQLADVPPSMGVVGGLVHEQPQGGDEHHGEAAQGVHQGLVVMGDGGLCAQDTKRQGQVEAAIVT